jgi:hypothetical protein
MRELTRPLDGRHGPVPPDEVRLVDWHPTLTKRKGVTKHKLLTERIIADIDADILPAHARRPSGAAICAAKWAGAPSSAAG